MYIESMWACPGEIYTTQAPVDTSLSAGSVVCVVLLVGMLAYFVFGWLVCAVKNRRDHAPCDVQANIPHVVFWLKLPALVWAGFTFTKDFALALCCGGGGDKADRLVTDSEDAVNPFAGNHTTLPVPTD